MSQVHSAVCSTKKRKMIYQPIIFIKGYSNMQVLKLSNLSIQCNHQMVTFCTCAVNLYQTTRSERCGLGTRLEYNVLAVRLILHLRIMKYAMPAKTFYNRYSKVLSQFHWFSTPCVSLAPTIPIFLHSSGGFQFH